MRLCSSLFTHNLFGFWRMKAHLNAQVDWQVCCNSSRVCRHRPHLRRRISADQLLVTMFPHTTMLFSRIYRHLSSMRCSRISSFMSCFRGSWEIGEPKCRNVCVHTLCAPVDKLCAIFEEFLGNVLEVLQSLRHAGGIVVDGDEGIGFGKMVIAFKGMRD